jgi:hypothetical protein
MRNKGNKPEIIFTGQEMNDNEEVTCASCKKGKVRLRHNAWFDPYIGKHGKYVHEECLSEKRKLEIKNGGI